MSQETEIDGRREGLALVRPSRLVGPYEEWQASPLGRPDLPDVVCARRPHPQRADKDVLRGRLEQASARSQFVEHQLIVQCFGILEGEADTLVQLLEWRPFVDLDALSRDDDLGPLPIAASLWIARQIVEALTHTHGLGVFHGALSPTHVLVDDTGAIKVDFALSGAAIPGDTATDYIDLRYVENATFEAKPRPRNDVFAVATILFELVSGRPIAADAPTVLPVRQLAPGTSERLEQTINAARSNPSVGLSDLRGALDQLFYIDHEGDDLADGQGPVEARVAALRAKTDESAAQLPTELMGGHFTRALEARLKPVEPQELTTHDTLDPSAGWSLPGRDGPTVATEPSMPPSESSTEPLAATPSHAYYRSSSHPQSLVVPPPSSSHVRPARPSPAVWMLVGFAVTFFIILIGRWFVPHGS